MGYWCSLVTQDATASARIGVEAETADQARDAILSLARSPAGQAMFELDEGNEPRPYFGDPDNLEQLDEAAFLDLRSNGSGLGLRYVDRQAQELIEAISSSVSEARRLLDAGDAFGALERLRGDLGMSLR